MYAMSSFGRMVRKAFGCLTVRGRWFIVIGAAAVIGGLDVTEPDLVRVGALLFVSPMTAALTALRSRGRLSSARRLSPRRVAAGEPTEVTTRVENVSRSRARALVAEDPIPYPLGGRPRFTLDAIEPGGQRELTYQIRSDTRGKFTIGPLRARVVDAFGLVQIPWAAFGTSSTLVVTPRIFPLPRTAAASAWLGEGGGGAPANSANGEDYAAPRQYQDGDGRHRVHWKSTARYGELMVRREEHQLRNNASVFLDTRRSAHAGGGPGSTFEFAVSAAASIGTFLSDEGRRTRLITDAGEIAPGGTSNDALLDTLAVITQSPAAGLRAGISALAGSRGQLIAVAGRLSDDDARALAAARRGNAPAMALLLAVSGWTADGDPDDAVRTAEILSAAGWRVAVASASTPLAAAWQQMHRPVPPTTRFETAGRQPGGR
jgi:uncharacterized protein (DUF58 family)